MEDGKVAWQDYQRHNTRQAEKVVEFLQRMETEAGVTVGQDRIFFTGSGAGFLAPLVGAKLIQEVVAVAACVERQHPDVRFVSEIGGEDMKTIFFTATGTGRSKQVYMQSACSGGTGTFIEKTARKLQVPSEKLAELPYAGHEPAQGLEQVRDLRRDRRQHAGEDRRAGRGDHRQPVRGGRLPEPGHADQGQHAGAGSAAARRPQSLLQGAAGGVAPSPGQAVVRSASSISAAASPPSSSSCRPRRSTTRAWAASRSARARSPRSASTRDATSSSGGSRRASTRRRPRRARGA